MSGKIIKVGKKEKGCLVLERERKDKVIWRGREYERISDLLKAMLETNDIIDGIEYRGNYWWEGNKNAMKMEYRGEEFVIYTKHNRIENMSNEKIGENVISAIKQIKEAKSEIDKRYPSKIFICF